jgi:site-specific DNA-methyltransferase (cytosine-N4-specific)
MSADQSGRGTSRSLVIQADAGRLPLPDASVDLIVTSPPYFALRSYTDGGTHLAGQVGSEATPGEFLEALLAATAECVRVLKPSGSLWVNLGDKYAGHTPGSSGGSSDGETRRAARPVVSLPGRPKSLLGLPWRYALRCVDELGLTLRAEVIWSKPNALPESVKDRMRRSHEQWFHFTLGPRYYAALDEIREPYQSADRRPGSGGGKWAQGTDAIVGVHASSTDKKGRLNQYAHPRGRVPGSVWTIPTAPLRLPDHLGVQHFAAFPPEWPRRLILAFCPPGGVVLDPFGGTGTTALVARGLQRTGISVDLSWDYCRVAQWRTSDPKQLAKVTPLAVTQLALDDEVAS